MDEDEQGADYDDNDLLDALADIIVDRQEKRSVSSLIRNRDMRSLSALYGKQGADYDDNDLLDAL